MIIGTNESLLGYIFGIISVSQDQISQSEDRFLMLVD